MASGLCAHAQAYLCCPIPDSFSVLWTSLTFAGWVIMILVGVSNAYLRRLDMVDTGCCGCRPLFGRRMQQVRACVRQVCVCACAGS